METLPGVSSTIANLTDPITTRCLPAARSVTQNLITRSDLSTLDAHAHARRSATFEHEFHALSLTDKNLWKTWITHAAYDEEYVCVSGV